MIINSIWWDDQEYAIEDLGDTVAATRITPDGTGLYASLDESARVTASLDDERDGADRRVA